MSKEKLAALLRESARAAAEERDFNAHVARVAKIAQPEIDKILAQYKAETSKSYACPSCGAVLEGWRPDEATSGVDNNDEDNHQDDEDDYSNRAGRVAALARSLRAATERAQR
jgi:hypothetical protein